MSCLVGQKRPSGCPITGSGTVISSTAFRELGYDVAQVYVVARIDSDVPGDDPSNLALVRLETKRVRLVGHQALDAEPAVFANLENTGRDIEGVEIALPHRLAIVVDDPA